jgi:hypothetical protein
VKAFLAAAVALLLLVGAIGGSYGLDTWRADRQQAAQQHQGEVFEQKLCGTLDALSARKPPAGKPSDESRQYLRWLHDQLAELGPDVGCSVRRQP